MTDRSDPTLHPRLEILQLRGELEATKLLLEKTRKQLSQFIADFCALRDALPPRRRELIRVDPHFRGGMWW